MKKEKRLLLDLFIRLTITASFYHDLKGHGSEDFMDCDQFHCKRNATVINEKMAMQATR